MASLRYIVIDVDQAVAFYRDNLTFKLDKHSPGKFAALVRDDLTLYLSPRCRKRWSGGRHSDAGWLESVYDRHKRTRCAD